MCKGSLGDPVVNITFGNDATPNGPLKPGVTNMAYINGGCPNDGQYTITNLSLGCFNNSWFLLAGDHTRDIGGRFMLINASFEPSDFYVDTVSGLCGNTVYELAAWVSNVLKPISCGGAGIKPNLTFKIETTSGTVLQQINSGDIVSGQEKTWQQYGTFFTMPLGTDKVVLRISNNSKGGCGNDLMLDDITFRPCGPNITATVNNTVQSQINVCENDKTVFQFSSSFPVDYASPQVQWQISTDTAKTWKDIPGEQSLNFTRKPTAGGSYQYRAVMAEIGNFSSPSCRISSNVTIINVNPLPDATNGRNLIGCTGSDFRLDAVDGTAFTYLWTGPNAFSSQVRNPFLNNVRFSDSGWYSVLVKTDVGCSRTDSFHLTVFPGTKAIISNDVNICEGSSTSLSASGGISYFWTPATGLSDNGSPFPVASPVDTTQYKVIVTNQYGCKDSGQVLVNVYKKLIVNAGPDKAIFEGDTVTLNGSIKGNPTSIYWLPDLYMQNSNTTTPVVSPVDNINYTLFGVSGAGCPLESDAVFVRVYKKLKIPNIFSPNGDGINDSWVIQNMDTYPLAAVKVFNRAGQIVFETGTGGKNWDGLFHGKAVPVGTYYYVIDLNVGIAPVSGWVVVIR